MSHTDPLAAPVARLGAMGGLGGAAGVGVGSLDLGLAYGFAPIRGMRLVTFADGCRSEDTCFAGIEAGGLLDCAWFRCVVPFSVSPSSTSGMGGCVRLAEGMSGYGRGVPGLPFGVSMLPIAEGGFAKILAT